MKTHKKVILFTSVQLQMVEDLKTKTGFGSLAEIIRNGLAMYHKSYFPSYKAVEISEDTALRHAEIKAKARVVTNKTKEALKYEKKIDICKNLLGGEVVENADGSKVCKFTQYSLVDDTEQMLPLPQVDKIIADTSLFMPTKESIFKNRPEVRKLFSKLSYYKNEIN
jgi:hypothetical protein